MKKRLSTGTKDSDSKKKRSKSETPVSLMNMPPIPAASVVESEMESLASELGLSAERLAALPLDQKWLLVCQSREKEGDSEVAEIVKKLSKGKVNLKEMIRIRTLLNSQPVGWVRNFLSKKGHTYLFEMFRNAAQRTKSPKARSNALEEDDMIAECCRAVKALMNFKEGFSRVLEIDDAMPLLLMSLEYINMVSQSSVLMVLAAVCVVSRSAQSRIVDDIRANKRYATIVNFMRTKDEDLKIGALTFINSILRGAEDSSSRCKLRAEFMKEGLTEVMKFVKQTKNDTLLTQLLVFDESLHGDSEGMELYKPKESSDKEYLKRIDSLEQKVKELTFENDRLKIELDKAKKAGPGLTGGIESLASNASSTTESTSSEVASTNAETDGGAPPPPPPPGDSGAPPPPPPPGGAIEEGGPPPPPPPPGGAGGPPPPPPPPGGGPPGPPPPPGAPAANRLPPKKKIQPGKKMRGFVWTQIADSKITDTVWEKLTDEKIKIDAKELEDLFAAAGPPPKIEGATGESGTPAGTAAAPKKPQVIHILDARKVNNIEIMLKGTKMAPGEIKSAVMSLDESVLTPDRLKAMKDFVPNAEEIKLLQDYPNKSELGNAEQYYLQIMDIPKLVQRINALVYKSNFEEKSQALIEETTHLKAALKSLKGNDRFLKVLEYILAIGNYLNGGTNRGGAYGFRLGSLAKLGEVKAQNGRDTLLHYLLEFIEKREKSLLSFVDELKSVQSAARVNIKETTGRITELKAGYEQLDRELKMPDVDAKFKGAMEGFVSKIGKIIQDLEKSATDIDTSFKDCLKFYGEPPATDAESFFGNISTFVAGFEKAQQDIIRNRQLAAKEELARQRELEREQLKTKRASTGTSNTTHSGLSGAPSGSPGTINRLKSKGALDDVINNLKAGQFGLRNTQSAEHKVFGNTNGPKRPLNFKE